jgi:dihydroorotase
MVPLLLNRLRKKSLSLERFVSGTCERPAELLNLEKGRIDVGYDADLIAVDLKNPRRIRAEDLHSKCGWTPYEGMEGVFPIATLLRGVVVAEDREIVSKPSGRYVGANH